MQTDRPSGGLCSLVLFLFLSVSAETGEIKVTGNQHVYTSPMTLEFPVGSLAGVEAGHLWHIEGVARYLCDDVRLYELKLGKKIKKKNKQPRSVRMIAEVTLYSNLRHANKLVDLIFELVSDDQTVVKWTLERTEIDGNQPRTRRASSRPISYEQYRRAFGRPETDIALRVTMNVRPNLPHRP